MKTTALLALSLLGTAPLIAAELPAWMAGTWIGTTDGVRMEEHWTAPEGTMLLGLHRDVSPKKTSFEFLRIENRNGSLVYVAMPGGGAAVEFPLRELAADRVTFENAAHDFPQQISYWRQGDRLCAKVSGRMGGNDVAEQWCWKRAKR